MKLRLNLPQLTIEGRRRFGEFVANALLGAAGAIGLAIIPSDMGWRSRHFAFGGQCRRAYVVLVFDRQCGGEVFHRGADRRRRRMATMTDVNAAEAAIYGLSAAGLLLLIVALLFVWGSPKAGHDAARSHSAAE